MSMPPDSAITAVLLALWRATGDLSMQELLRQCALPAAEIYGVLEVLVARGCRIDRSPAGVRLRHTALSSWSDILEADARAAGRRVGRRVMVFSSTASTNDIALQHAGDASGDGLVVLADEQTAGRGRLGRSWAAQPGQSVLMSLFLRQVPAEAMDRLTLLAGLAAAEAIERAFEGGGVPGRVLTIKWPNDLLIEGRKLAGILVERPAGGSGAVVGIGVNVGQGADDFPTELRARATSLRAAGALVDRLRVISLLLEAFDGHLVRGFAGEGWLDDWKRRCELLGTRITIRSSGTVISGYVLDVSPLQGLVLKDDSGAIHFFSAQLTSLQ